MFLLHHIALFKILLSGTKKNGKLQVQTKNKIIHCDKQCIDMCKTLKHSLSETHGQSCTCLLIVSERIPDWLLVSKDVKHCA